MKIVLLKNDPWLHKEGHKFRSFDGDVLDYDDQWWLLDDVLMLLGWSSSMVRTLLQWKGDCLRNFWRWWQSPWSCFSCMNSLQDTLICRSLQLEKGLCGLLRIPRLLWCRILWSRVFTLLFRSWIFFDVLRDLILECLYVPWWDSLSLICHLSSNTMLRNLGH